MAEPPLLAKPNADEVLYLYLVISDKAISAMLVKEEEKIQKPVYYVSKTLHGAELNYSAIENSHVGHDNSFEEIKALLPSSQNRSLDGPTAEKHHAQP